MEQLKAELASIEQQLAAEKQKGSEGDKAIIERLEGEQAKVLEQIMLAEQQEREQHTQEVNETNSDIVVSIFNALFPDTKTVETKFGLTEFGELRTDFYQLVDGVLADRTQLMDDKKAYELAQKDEKIRLLSGQGMELQRQLDEAKNMIVVQRENYEGYKADHEDFIDELKSNLEKAERQLSESKDQIEKGNAAIAENCELRRQIIELEEKLEAAQKPREEAKPSQSFTDRMNEIKSKNEARIKTAAELAAEGQLGFRGKVEVPSVSPFRHENIEPPATYVRNDQVLAAGDAPVGSQFPEPPSLPTPEAGYNVVAGPSNVQGESGQEPASKGWVEERIAERFEALKKEILGEQVA